jgi:hypothetical protein
VCKTAVYSRVDMTFDPQDLRSHIVFTEADRNTDVKLVKGKNKWVDWKDCKAISYEENGEKQKHSKVTGSVVLGEGIAVLFAEGYVKEE